MSKLDKVFTCSSLNTDFRPDNQDEIKFPTFSEDESLLSNKKFLDNFKPENMKLRKIKFPKSLTKGQKAMNNLIIKPDKYTIYQISKDDIQELKHIPEQDVEGFAMCPTMNISDIYTPKWHFKEEWYVILKGGKKIDLTKKQYNIIKGWFKGENK